MVKFELDFAKLPPKKDFVKGIRRAPTRGNNLSEKDTILALKNALRYIPVKFHDELAVEFLEELKRTGRIYGYRFRPEGRIFGKPVSQYKGRIPEAKGMQVMIDNNLDFEVALYPYELVTYGETGQVFQNWMQYLLIKKYLENMGRDQTLVVSSGHPLGLFPSRSEAPRAIITNGLMVGMFDTPADFKRLAALGCVNYGQMTAGGWMYIGPQGIVHGTYITLLNAGRQYLGIPEDRNLGGHLFISSGLGGMSGAQPKAVEIAGGVGVIAEVDGSRIETRHKQGWVSMVSSDLAEIERTVVQKLRKKEAYSIAYHGNMVELLEYAHKHKWPAELISDQTSCHAVYDGGYTPQGLLYADAKELIKRDPKKFEQKVNESLKRHYAVIKKLSDAGSHFWDYGNSFMKAVYDAGVREISKNPADTNDGFIFPSYVEDIMGPVCFDYGYGPFRWVCLSGKAADLQKTDKAAMSCIDPGRRSQDFDNFNWIRDAAKNKLVVGTQARILYADAETRVKIALKFNKMVREKKVGPVILGRDHHDVSGTDSPFRETANIYDGSALTSDMAHQCFAGNIARGMTYVVLSNGGGVGTGKCVNGGNGIFLDGSTRMDKVLKSGLDWDVMGGVARRAWARNDHAVSTVREWNSKMKDKGHITEPRVADDDLVRRAVRKARG
ncbi:MAG TPA: urocanate hydratase [Acidobacteriota bacterium]|nr:urocanate hydratase [Acidobacteriota bacterium]HNT16878.1 urocanate hydratase [Acidobacteriota bacterium]HQO19601.1 urocanate hydratase [Acidobacteriota bacterium]HQQ46224.1 urocanate hydratase [Acidobacteriota bacterium]